MLQVTSRSIFVVTVAAVLCTLIGAGSAAAHVAGGTSPTNARSMVTDIRPAVAGVDVNVGLGGQFVRVRSQGSGPIVVLGYRSEPFLRLSQGVVQVNAQSTTARQSGQLPTRQSEPTASQGDVRWVPLSEGNSVTWTDDRVDGRDLPAGTSRAWAIPLVVDGQPVTVVGVRSGLSPPSPWPWMAGLAVVALAVATLGWVHGWHRPMAAVTVAAVVAFGVHMVGAGASPQPRGSLASWTVIAMLGGICLLVAGITLVSTLRRAELAASRLPILGVTLLLLAAGDISGLWNAQLPFVGPAVLDRILLVIIYGAALGLLVAGVQLSRRPVRPKSMAE